MKLCKDGSLPEHGEQVKFIRWARSWLPENLRSLIFAIPNGGKRNVITAIKLKAEGVVPGVPDIFFAWPRQGYHGLFIEMKKAKGGMVSEEQAAMHHRLTLAGYRVVVCHGACEASAEVAKYMKDLDDSK